MTWRHPKGMVVALLLAFCLCGLMASTSQAANLTASSYPAVLTGQTEGDNELFHLPNSNNFFFECGAHFYGQITESSSTFETEVTFSQCNVGLVVVLVENTGCKWRFHLGSGSGDLYSGKAQIVCPAGKSIDFSIPAMGECAFTLGPQTGLETVDLINNTPTKDISAQMTIEGLAYTVTKSGVGCGLGSVGGKTGARWIQGLPVRLDPPGGQTLDIG